MGILAVLYCNCQKGNFCNYKIMRLPGGRMKHNEKDANCLAHGYSFTVNRL